MKWEIKYHGEATSQDVAGETWKRGEVRTIANPELADYLDKRAGFTVKRVGESPSTRRKASTRKAPAKKAAPAAAKKKAATKKTKAKAKVPPEAETASE